MARVVIGNFCKGKTESEAKAVGKKPHDAYIKLKQAVNLPEGAMIQVETKKTKLASLERSVSAGKLDPEYAQKRREELERMPEWLIAELVVYQD